MSLAVEHSAPAGAQRTKIRTWEHVAWLTVSGREAGLQFGRQSDSRTVHRKWTANSIPHERFVIGSGFQCNRLSKQSNTQAGVFKLRPRFPRQFVAVQETI